MLSSSCTQFKCARQFPWYTGTGKSKNFYHHWDEVSLNYAVLGVALFTLLRIASDAPQHSGGIHNLCGMKYYLKKR